jgi:hypothetical protein
MFILHYLKSFQVSIIYPIEKYYQFLWKFLRFTIRVCNYKINIVEVILFIVSPKNIPMSWYYFPSNPNKIHPIKTNKQRLIKQVNIHTIRTNLTKFQNHKYFRLLEHGISRFPRISSRFESNPKIERKEQRLMRNKKLNMHLFV